MDLEKLNPIAIQVDARGSVLVRDESINFQAWIDVDVHDGDVRADWNKDIFYLDNPNDVREREMQKSSELYMAFTEVAIDKLVGLGYIKRNEDTDEWEQVK